MGKLTILLTAFLIAAVFSPKGEKEMGPVQAWFWRIAAVLTVVGVLAGSVYFILDLRGTRRTVAIAAVAIVGLITAGYIHRVRSHQRRQGGSGVPVDQWKDRGLGVRSPDDPS